LNPYTLFSFDELFIPLILVMRMIL
jgi:hypothetical protein